ncbi:hypothetical protein VTK73DRAFT_6776 [Phialemonium thermophilum]|uniref:Uncharacterized protein n=1 Tax=Phialemonium thermophilum TaxID=223376 RepID=A0ABR3Y8E0_9PEZI
MPDSPSPLHTFQLAGLRAHDSELDRQGSLCDRSAFPRCSCGIIIHTVCHKITTTDTDAHGDIVRGPTRPSLVPIIVRKKYRRRRSIH